MASCSICIKCKRTIDCSGDGICEVCEIDAVNDTSTIVRAAETGAKKKSPTNANGNTPMVGSYITSACSPVVSTDHQIMSILRRLHQSMHGPERGCRWNYHDARQVYWCDHVSIPSREVADLYWRQFR